MLALIFTKIVYEWFLYAFFDPAYNDQDSELNDGDSDYRSETGSRPLWFLNTAQTNSSVHQYPIGHRVPHLALSRDTDSLESFELDYREIGLPR